MTHTTGVALNLPASIINAIQDGIIDRIWKEALTPRLLFFLETMTEEFEGKIGQEIWIPKKGLLTTGFDPLPAGTDPTPKSYDYEKYLIAIKRWADSVDTNKLQSSVSLMNKFLQDAQSLAENAGMTMNRVVRSELFRPYLAGQTTATAAGVTTTALPVASLNGFTSVMSNGKPVDVSGSNKLAITIGGVAANVVAATPTDATKPFGAGTLTLEANASWSQYASVLSTDRSFIVRSGGGTSVEAVGSGDLLTLATLRNAGARLKKMSVKRFPDGFYHAHVSVDGVTQLFSDTEFQNLLNGAATSNEAKMGEIANVMGIKLIENELAPDPDSVDGGVNEIGGQLTNSTSIGISRAIVLGQGAIDERYLDQEKVEAEAGDSPAGGKIGNFRVEGNGISMFGSRIKHIIRSPMDRMQETVSQSWRYIGGFGCQTDVLTGDAARYKRAVVIEHAVSA